MRLALHIFRKDLERLWPAILVTFALLGLFVAVESGDTRQGTLLDLVLPFAWCLLIGMAIQQDSLVGDRQFWFALPCGWRPVSLAKVAFILATIQVPYLVATATILAIRGFNPLAYVPHLMWKQLVLLALIVPAVAVATVAKNIGQFLLILIATLSGVMFLSDQVNRLSRQPGFAWDSRWALALVILSVGALPVAAIQFARRRTGPSRGIALATALAAAGLYHWMSRDASAAVTASLSPASTAKVSVHLAPDNPESGIRRRYYNSSRTTALIPIQFSGLPDYAVRFELVSFAVRTGGQEYEAQWPRSSDEVRAQRISASIDDVRAQRRGWLAIELYRPAIANTLRSGPVTITGRAIVRLYRIGPNVHLADLSDAYWPEIGHCKAGHGLSTSRPGDVIETLACESPVVDPHDITGVPDAWPVYGLNPGFLGRPFQPFSLYPDDPWLSPLHRSPRTFEAMNAAGWKIIPSAPTGYVLIDYTFPDLDLNQFILQDPRKEKSQ